MNAAKVKRPMPAAIKPEPSGNWGTPRGAVTVLKEEVVAVEHSVVLNTSVMAVVTRTTVVVVSVAVEAVVTVCVPVDTA
jgi:hypothetical protein